jgi:long-chain acyl-CoA synthetase
VNLASIIDGHPGDAVALVSRRATTTYAELRAQVACLRGGLTGLGLQPGDRVGILCANNWYFVVSYLGVLGAGLVAVPLNPLSPGPEVQRQLAAVGVRAVIAGPSGKAAITAVDRAAVPTLEHIITPRGVDVAGALDLDDLMAGEPAALVERADADLAVLLFTSGTAGSPKAAMLTHGNLRANFGQAGAVPQSERSDDVILGIVPLYHILGLNGVLGLALASGASIVLIERFDPASALEAVQAQGVTIVAGPPTMWSAWASLSDVPDDAMASVRLAISGAARLPDDVAQRIEQRFGVHLWEGYGLTETAPIVTTSIGTEAPLGSIGVPVPGVEVRLVDGDGDDVLVGDAGEIWVRGPNVFAGYWEDAAATGAALTEDGWLRTGDMAVLDDDGFLYLVDRAKDLIIVSGFNVYPAEVEEVLAEHPAVEACAVVGVPHPHTGETVKAHVVPVAGTAVEEDDLIEWCQARIARYKCPTKVNFTDEIPQGLAGKILRRELRSEVG